MGIVLDNKLPDALSTSNGLAQELPALQTEDVSRLSQDVLNQTRRGGPGFINPNNALQVDLILHQLGLTGTDPVNSTAINAPFVGTKITYPQPAPHSPDLDQQAGTIQAFNQLIAENNPTAAQGYLNNIIACGMEMGKFKPGHLEAVADIVNNALKQPGVSPAMAQEVLAHLRTQLAVRCDDSTLAGIMDMAGAGIAAGNAQALNGDTVNQDPAATQEILDRRVRAVLIDLTMTSEQKLGELQSLKDQYKLSGQGLRDSIDRALPNDQNKFVETLNLEQVQKLQTDMNKVDNKFGSLFGLWENNGLQRALDSKEEALKKQAESQKLDADRLAQEQAALLEAQRVTMLKDTVNATLLDGELSSSEKINAIRAIQRGNNLNDKDMGELIRKALEEKGVKFVDKLGLEETQKLLADMKALDKAFGGLRGNDALQRALKNNAHRLIDEE